jgi:hypothetical protein
LNPRVVVGMVYLFQIDSSLDVHATPRSSAAEHTSRAGNNPTPDPKLLTQAVRFPPRR